MGPAGLLPPSVTAGIPGRMEVFPVTNSEFPRILTLLRKERGLSQKRAAADLGISQALLSHYEKGMRECGLDFLARAASYYGVSCDYLLGRTAHRRPDPFPEEWALFPQERGASPPRDLQLRLLEDSLHIVFGILEKINSEGLSRHTCAYLSCAVYKVFRLLYGARGKNPPEAFSLDRRLFEALAAAHMALEEAKARCLLEGADVDGEAGIPPQVLPSLTPERISQDFPQYAPSLFELVRSTELAVDKKL